MGVQNPTEGVIQIHSYIWETFDSFFTRPDLTLGSSYGKKVSWGLERVMLLFIFYYTSKYLAKYKFAAHARKN